MEGAKERLSCSVQEKVIDKRAGYNEEAKTQDRSEEKRICGSFEAVLSITAE